MIRHIFKIIWNERKTNIWIFFEFVIVYCILWFCTDYIFYMTKKYMEPRGFDIEHVYSLDISRRGNLSEKQESEVKDERTEARIIEERLKRYPGIEAVSFSLASMPYTQSWSSSTMYANGDTVGDNMRQHWVSSGYFDVFKIRIQEGTIFDWNDPADKNKVLVAPDYKNEILNHPARNVSGVGPFGETPYEVIGITSKIKQKDFETYGNIIFQPLNKNYLNEICFRVTPEADKNFVERFTNDMKQQLTFGRRYMRGVEPLSKQRERVNRDTTNTIKSVYSVTAFLIVNIFLGIIGTFWFRTNARKSEIGLRAALGSPKRKVKFMIMTETLLLLFLASIVSAIICLNIGQTEFLTSIGIPRIDREVNMISRWQDVINYILTFAFLAVISLIAVWYPANQAANMQPAEALRDE